jgi:hypothetical protein
MWQSQLSCGERILLQICHQSCAHVFRLHHTWTKDSADWRKSCRGKMTRGCHQELVCVSCRDRRNSCGWGRGVDCDWDFCKGHRVAGSAGRLAPDRANGRRMRRRRVATGRPWRRLTWLIGACKMEFTPRAQHICYAVGGPPLICHHTTVISSHRQQQQLTTSPDSSARGRRPERLTWSHCSTGLWKLTDVATLSKSKTGIGMSRYFHILRYF